MAHSVVLLINTTAWPNKNPRHYRLQADFFSFSYEYFFDATGHQMAIQIPTTATTTNITR